MSNLIVIPARWGSTRFPGKPLAKIAGHTLLARVIDLARRAAAGMTGVDLAVATDDERIAAHAYDLGCRAVLTDPAISSGSGRALAAARAHTQEPRFVVNLQGDAPFIPPDAIRAVLAALMKGGASCVTPVTQLPWEDLDRLRALKEAAAASGTTCVATADDRALWFSKRIIPFLRDEAGLRALQPLSPILRHLGLYGYSLSALEQFEASPPTALEQFEGLEQLRLLELGIDIHVVRVAQPVIAMSGIDAPPDIGLAEQLIARHGDPMGR